MRKVNEILQFLDNLYPEPKCALNFSNPYELLVAVILSAQCTDKRVNIVTKELFKRANSPEQMILLGETKLKQIIYPCGFYNSKSKAIIQTSKDLIDNFNSKVPNSLDDLTKLKGVGRKTANVVISTAFGGQTIAVDTHVHRISKRLELTHENSTPFECEKDLLNLIPYNKRSKFHHQLIWFGREICKSQNPSCDLCELKKYCCYYNNKRK